MYETLRNHLAYGRYTLEDAKARIDYGVLAGKITPEQAGELLALAEGRAVAESAAELELAALRQEIEALNREGASLRAENLARERENLDSMLAITEIFEMMIGGM